MDRKKNSIISDILDLSNEVSMLKCNQYFGYDTTELKMASSNDSYDLTVNLTSGQRYTFAIYCYNQLDAYPQHTIGYNQILFQIWINNMSTPYYGESSGIGVFSSNPTNSPFAPGTDMLVTQIINTSSSTKTVYIKGYAITTMPSAEITAGVYYG